MHRIEETLERGICIGCGACSVATGGQIPIYLDKTGIYTANVSAAPEELRRKASAVCPFSDESHSEDVLGAPSSNNALMQRDSRVGQYTSAFVARVADEDYLLESSSGGLTSWLIGKLWSDGYIDGFVSVGNVSRASENVSLFAYQARDGASYRSVRKSAYYATTLIEAITIVKETDKRFALVGVPCFIKAARSLCESDHVLRDRICFFIGLVCGHMKTQDFGSSLAWQLGVPPQELESVDFRVKVPGRPSSSYDFSARSLEGTTVTSANKDLIGSNWGHGAFQPEACNFCDDVFAETSDVSFGDAWLPEYTKDWRGRNVVVSRNSLVDTILNEGIERGVLIGEQVDVDFPVQSQLGNFRHRRDGLAVRLADDKGAGLSVPRKRVEPDSSAVTRQRRSLIRQRRRMSRVSISAYADAKRCNDLSVYLNRMGKEVRRYQTIEKLSMTYWTKRVAGLLNRVFGR